MRQMDGPVLLLAVPGSGKTTVLVTRLGYMVYCKNIRPENILTVTYTVAATKDMKARFVRFFGEDHADKLTFRTINGLCAVVIRYYAARKAHGPSPWRTMKRGSTPSCGSCCPKAETGTLQTSRSRRPAPVSPSARI